MKIHLLCAIAACAISLCKVPPVLAQATGGDMWTNEMDRIGLFRPHIDSCDSSTESFIKVTDDNIGLLGASTDLGFCIEKSTRNSGAASRWVDARHDCLSRKKRLPEPGELQRVCFLNSASQASLRVQVGNGRVTL